MAEVRRLFREYQAEIGVDLCFQGFEEELSTLPGRYSEPSGTILLAERGGAIAGMVALRPWEKDIAEMKRLYVLPTHQGSGLGRKLVYAIIDAARKRGYKSIRLDTLPSMQRATDVYRKIGFREIPPYTSNPVSGSLFLELPL